MSSVSSSPSKAQSTTAGSRVGGLNALSAMRAHEEQIAQRIQQLESIINDTNLGIVARTKAKVELALLKNNDDEILALRREEIDTLTQNIDVSKNTRATEGRIRSNQDRLDKDHAIANHLQELHKLALKRQDEARERAEHARIRAIEAEAYVAECEEEAQALIAQAKAAMTKLNEARVRAGEERRLLQEAQAAEEFQIQEIERLVKRGGEEKKGEDSTTQEGGASTVVSKLTLNESQFDSSIVDDDEDGTLETDLPLDISYEDELKAVASSFDDRDGHITTHQHDLKYWMDKVATLQQEIKMLEANAEESNTMAARQAEKISSLEKHLESGGQSQEYWEEQAAKLSEELREVEQTRIDQELELQVLQKKFDKEDTQLQFLKKEIKDLRSMKLLLELKLVNVGEKERAKLQALKEEIEGILKERESALEAVRLTQVKYEKRIAEREDEIATLQRDMDNHSMELKQAQALLEEKERELEENLTMLQAKQTFEEGDNNNSEGSSSSSLPLANQNEYKKLKLQLKESKAQVVKLEEINEEYSATIAKQKKKLGKNGDKMKEAFMVQDKEIERLSSTLTVKNEKAGALSEELKHWKDQSSQYEKSIAERDEEIASLLRHMDDNIAELNKTQSALKAKEGMAKKVATHYEKRIADRDDNIASLQREADLNSLELKQAQALLKQKEGLVRKLEGSLARLQQAKQQTSNEGDKEEEEHDEEVVQTLATLATRRLSDAAMNEEFMAELDLYKERLAMLEEINEDQKAMLVKQNKKLAKKDQLKEAFMMQDKEIQRLSSSLAIVTQQAENSAEEAEHWKANATELSNNLTMLEQQRDMMKDNWIETENKLNKLEEQQQQQQQPQQPSESRRSSSGLSPQMSPMMEEGEFKFVESDGGYPSFPSFSHDGDDSSYVGGSSIGASVDTGFEDRVENAALKELLTRALAERDKFAAENDKLKNPNESESKDENKDESKPVQSEESKKEITELRSKILELAEEKDNLDRKLRQLIDTVGSSNLKRHEYQARLRDVEEERRKLSKKLKVLLELADLHTGNDGGAADDKKKDKKKSRTQVYQLSCKQCKSDLDYIGKTKSELKYKVRDHFKDICQLVNQEQTGTNEDGTKKMNDSEFAFSEFASHFARHCRNAQTPEEVLMWCAANMKVKRQKVLDDEDNAEDCVQRTVYQLSCKDCKSNLHYIGSTHQNLKRAVVKHYNEIWKIVDEEYGDGGYRKDADDLQRNKAGLSKFAHSAAHFAKHCRTAKSNTEVKKWCEDNIKVEKWAMVCKTCLGTSIDTVQPSKANTIMSYKVEEKFDPDAGKKS